MKMSAGLLGLAIAAALFLTPCAWAQDASTFGGRLASDFRFTVDNVVADARDIVTSPRHLPDLFSGDGLARRPAFYYTLLGAGAALGGAFALDQTVRSRISNMSAHDADRLELGGRAFVGGATALLYGYGLYAGDSRARQFAITGAEGAGVAALIALVFKYGFARLRPRQGHGAFAFFDHGKSFVSMETAPFFAMATAVSEYSGNKWYVALPMYSGALALGLGRMGHDEHWLSDVVGSAIVGVATTELLLYLHARRTEDPHHFRLFPVMWGHANGVGLGFDW